MVRARSRILAVDDDPVDIAVIKRLLSKKDYDLRTAASGEEALEVAAEFQPDIILLDVIMSGISGYEVCRRIRADAKLKRTKVIMVSGLAMVSERLQGYEAGADDYITKPCDEAELLAKIKVYLRLKSVEEVDRFKTDILALLSQEACTPLSDIINPAERLMSTISKDAEEQKRLVEQIHDTARQLRHFFENAVTLSALKSGQRQFDPAPTNLRDLVRGAVSEVAAKAVERKVRIEEEFSISPTICLDEQEIRRVIVTLLDNAIRFSPIGGTVAIRVASDSEDVYLSVTDQGEGIDPDRLDSVFDEFSDVDTDRCSQGQGLSLAIARQIALGHNGTINVESKKSSGATFTLRLPATLALEEAHCEN